VETKVPAKGMATVATDIIISIPEGTRGNIGNVLSAWNLLQIL